MKSLPYLFVVVNSKLFLLFIIKKKVHMKSFAKESQIVFFTLKRVKQREELRDGSERGC